MIFDLKFLCVFHVKKTFLAIIVIANTFNLWVLCLELNSEKFSFVMIMIIFIVWLSHSGFLRVAFSSYIVF